MVRNRWEYWDVSPDKLQGLLVASLPDGLETFFFASGGSFVEVVVNYVSKGGLF